MMHTHACVWSSVLLLSAWAADAASPTTPATARSPKTQTLLMSSQSAFPTVGGTQATANEIPWVDVTNIFATGSASALIYPLNAGDQTGYLIGTGFGFTVPSNATILGVEAEIFWYDSSFNNGDHAKEDEVRLWYAGAPIGTNKSTYADIPIPPPTTSTVYGSPTDTWNTTLTPAIVNSPTFGMAFSAYHVDTGQSNSSIDIDAVKITVYYQ